MIIPEISPAELEQMRELVHDFSVLGKRAPATGNLAKFGEKAVYYLRGVFDGTLLNEHGQPLRNFSEFVRCSIISCIILGKLAKPLEALIADQLADGGVISIEALHALRQLEILEPETISKIKDLTTKYSSLDFEVNHDARCTIEYLEYLAQNTDPEPLHYIGWYMTNSRRISDQLVAICRSKRSLTEDFIRANADSLDWSYVSESQNLSESFICEFKHKIHIGLLKRNKHVSKETIEAVFGAQ